MVLPKDRKAKLQKVLLLTASEVNTRDLSQSSVFSEQQKWESLSYWYMHIHEGAWMVGRVQASVDRSQEGQKRSTFLSIPVDLVVGISILQNGSRPCFRLVFAIKRELRVFVIDLIFLLLLFLLPVNNLLFMHSFVPLRPFITETCSRSSIMARLRPRRA